MNIEAGLILASGVEMAEDYRKTTKTTSHLRLNARRKKNKGGQRLAKYWKDRRERTEENADDKKSENEKSISLHGRRIVDINYFIDQVMALDNHPRFHCTFKDMYPVRENRRGFVSVITFRCRMCKIERTIRSDYPSDTLMDVNTAAVSGTISTGGGHAQLEEMLSTMNIPSISNKTFKKCHDRLAEAWEKTAHDEMEAAVKLEAIEAVKRGQVDKDGIPLLTVTADGSWAKRSYRKNYNSLSGVAVIVGYYTRKVLFMGVKNKYCTTCARAKVKDEAASEHICCKNWGESQSSTSMEAAIIVEGFISSLPVHGVIFAKMIADGDSSVYKKILDARPYKNVTVEKVECRNHLLRNYCNKLNDLVVKSDQGRNPIVLRKKLGANVKRFRYAARKAIEHRKNENGALNERIDELRKDILNSPSHIFGDHLKCSDRGYFCDGTMKPNEIDVVPDLKLCGLWDQIMEPVRYLSLHARSLIQDVDSNSSEQYNSVVAKFIGGKRINFALGRSYQARCAGAVVQHNSGTAQYTLYKSMFGASPGQFCKTTQMKRKRKSDSQRILAQIKKPKTSKMLFGKQHKTCDEDYGPNVQRPDMNEEDFSRECQQFLEGMKKTKDDRENLERLTILQSGSGQWIEERRKLLTASNFGAVCKRRLHTSCERLVKQIIYNSAISSASLEYGRVNEHRAIKTLAEKADVCVKPCGLFIDPELPYLGATPDGLIDDDGIVEVKCPSSAVDMTPDEAILSRKVTAFEVKNGEITGLNKSHNYFFQIQGQLRISRRKYCLFAIWTPKGIKIERIEKDDSFWKSEMEPKLIQFYMDCLLPELVDPRNSRSMSIRNPVYVVEAQEALKKKKAEKEKRKQQEQSKK